MRACTDTPWGVATPTLMLLSRVHAARCVLRSTNTCCSGSQGRRGPYLFGMHRRE